MNNEEELGYNSSAPDINTRRSRGVIQDERDLPALTQLQNQIESDIDSYSRNSRLVLGHKVFTLEQQLAINESITAHLNVYKAMVDNAITNVKEAQNG